MAKISSYSKDNTPGFRDRVIGTDNNNNQQTANFCLGDIVGLAKENISDNLIDSSLPVDHENNIVSSYISNAIVSTSAGSRVPTTGSTNSVLPSGVNEVTVGSNIRTTFFANTSIVLQGARIKFENISTGIVFLSTIISFDPVSGIVRFTDNMSDEFMRIASLVEGGDNVLTVYRNDGVTIDGDVVITGSANVQGNVIESAVTFEQTEGDALKILETVTFDATGTTATFTADDGTTRDFTGGGVQSDWGESNTQSLAFIQNKPRITEGFINTRDNTDTPIWCGTNAQFQELERLGNVDPNVLYFRTV